MLLFVFTLISLSAAKIQLTISETQKTKTLPEFLIYGVKTFNDYNATTSIGENRASGEQPSIKLEFKNKNSEKKTPLYVIPVLCNQRKEEVMALLKAFYNRMFFDNLKDTPISCNFYFDDCVNAELRANTFSYPFESRFSERSHLVAFFGNTEAVETDYEINFEIKYYFLTLELEQWLPYVYFVLCVVIFVNLYSALKFL